MLSAAMGVISARKPTQQTGGQLASSAPLGAGHVGTDRSHRGVPAGRAAVVDPVGGWHRPGRHAGRDFFRRGVPVVAAGARRRPPEKDVARLLRRRAGLMRAALHARARRRAAPPRAGRRVPRRRPRRRPAGHAGDAPLRPRRPAPAAAGGGGRAAGRRWTGRRPRPERLGVPPPRGGRGALRRPRKRQRDPGRPLLRGAPRARRAAQPDRPRDRVGPLGNTSGPGWPTAWARAPCPAATG